MKVEGKQGNWNGFENISESLRFQSSNVWESVKRALMTTDPSFDIDPNLAGLRIRT